MSDFQEEALVNFQAMTDNWDPEIAKYFLVQNEWDVTVSYKQNAVRQFLEQSQDTQPAQVQEPAQPQLQVDQFEGSNWMSNVTEQAMKIGEGLISIASSFFSTLSGNNQEQRATNSPSVSQFVYQLKQAYPDANLPNFVTCSLQQAVQNAYSQKKLLLIYIHCWEIPPEFIYKTLTSDIIIGMLDQYVLWGVDNTSKDGLQASRQLNVEIFPCMAIVKPENASTSFITEIRHGTPSIAELIEFLDRNLLELNQQNFSIPQAATEERIIRDQQDFEFQQAEQLMRERQNNEILKQREQEQIQRAIEQEEEMKRQLKQQKIENLPPEPAEGYDIGVIVFRLPEGQKKERRFNKSDKIQSIYDYLESLDFDMKFEIVSGFPSRVLSNTEATIDEEGLYPQAVVHVREVL